MAKLVNGTIKWFNNEKGYGFIKQSTGGADIFVHFKQVNNPSGGRVSLADGQAVTFEIGQGRKGPQAENVTVV
jgi:CspA family cold shock protein